METWLIVLLSVLGVFLFLILIPFVKGAIYRTCSRKCRSKQRLDGKTVIVTGASAGIGRETALILAGRGARVIMACRNMAKAQAVAADIVAVTGNQDVVVRPLDLADLNSVRQFADRVVDEEEGLHILINNGGILTSGPKRNSPQGFEITMATNHYGCFLLTNLLLDKLRAHSPSRIVVVSSVGYMLNNLDVDDLNFEHRAYGTVKAYCQSKLCNILFTKELAKRIQGSGVTANCLHPGFVATDIFNRENTFKGKLNELSATIEGKTPVQGAQTTVYLALSEEVQGMSGDYYDNCKKTTVYRKANDMELARKLWEQSCKDVGLTP